MKVNYMTPRPQLLTLALIALLAALIASCASKNDARTELQIENQSRSYERFKTDHTMKNRDELGKAGIHYDGQFFYVVISLSDSGTDKYPEWACDRFLSMLYGYGAAAKSMVSDNEFYELALKFTLEKIEEGKYENLALVSIKEKDVDKFLKNYQEGD
jgi:hypothetical protein